MTDARTLLLAHFCTEARTDLLWEILRPERGDREVRPGPCEQLPQTRTRRARFTHVIGRCSLPTTATQEVTG